MSEDRADDEHDASLRATIKGVMAFYDELNGESARAAAILAVGQIDNELNNILVRYFPGDVDKKVWDRIFGPGKPMCDLSNRTNLLEAFGAFGPETRKVIGKLGTVRNKFAHDIEVREFVHKSVLPHCIELGKNPIYSFQLSKKATDHEVRARFTMLAKCLCQRLEMVSPLTSGPGDPQGKLP